MKPVVLKKTKSLALNYFSNMILKAKEYEALKEKYNSITNRPIKRSSSQEFPVKELELKTLSKRISIYEKEFDSLSSRLSKPVPSEMALTAKLEQLEQKLNSLEKENCRLNACKLFLPSITSNSIKTEIEESYRQAKALTKLIKELEQRLETNPKECKNIQERYEKQLIEYEKLREQVGNYVRVIPKKKYFKKKRYLESLLTSWKSNTTKYEQQIAEMEEELAKLKEKYMQVYAKLFKKSQQRRLIQMSYEEAFLQKENAAVSARPDINHPGVSFMYKPSVKTLYNI